MRDRKTLMFFFIFLQVLSFRGLEDHRTVAEPWIVQ